MQEAVSHYRTLATADPDGFLPDLALCLNNLSVRLAEVERTEESLGPIEASVAIRRALAETNRRAFLPDLAGALNNLSLGLGELGRHEQALQASEEAVTLYRQLAELLGVGSER